MAYLAKRLVLGTLLVLLAAVGCSKKAPPKSDAPPPEVVYVLPVGDPHFVEREEFTGYTKAVKTVDLRARVTGYLLSKEEGGIPFKDGEDVVEGMPLFKIDSRTYRAEEKRAEASLRSAEATLDRLSGDLRRARASGSAVSLEERERIAGNKLEAEAAVGVARAVLETARLNVGYTTIKAPFDGRVSRQTIDPGNLVKADDTILTTIVSLDPVQAYFDVDERTVLRIRKLIHKGEAISARGSSVKMKVDVALADEPDFQAKRCGEIDFIDNQLDQGTGTLRLRAEIKNPTVNGSKTPMISPGMFVRIRLPVGKPRSATFVPEAALGSDQGRRFLYVLDKDKKKGEIQEEVETKRMVKDEKTGEETEVVDKTTVVRGLYEAIKVEVRVGQPENDLRVVWNLKDGPFGKRDEPLSKNALVVVTGQQRISRSGAVVAALLQKDLAK